MSASATVAGSMLPRVTGTPEEGEDLHRREYRPAAIGEPGRRDRRGESVTTERNDLDRVRGRHLSVHLGCQQVNRVESPERSPLIHAYQEYWQSVGR